MTIRWKPMELALALLLAALFAYAACAALGQQTLADGLVRLHVIANSDSAADQQIKLRVRDRVLAVTEPLLDGADSPEAVRQILRDNLQGITDAAQAVLDAQGAPYSLSAQLAGEYYPTRTYDTFALPAGEYTGLKIRLGAAQGKNWWCVVFPPLCTDAAEAPAGSLCQKTTFRFKTAELVGRARAWLQNR
ncbi:MAG TPA: stage II sporulation protein R [Candidatus Butyricicoccus avicola]|nr:stage II sporulation protein R [Candidatus Butyricicoccus avicola]